MATEKELKDLELKVDPDASAMIVDRKTLEARLKTLVDEANQLKIQFEQSKKQQEAIVMEIDRRQGAINELNQVLANNPSHNASSLQTANEGEKPK